MENESGEFTTTKVRKSRSRSPSNTSRCRGSGSTTPTCDDHHGENNGNDDDGNSFSTTSDFQIQERIHNTQHFQFCAIHTLNNLLQLTEKTITTTTTTTESEKNTSSNHFLLLICGKIYHLDHDKMSTLRKLGTKEEFDQIANDFIRQEKLLLSNNIDDIADECSSSSVNERLSFWTTLMSNHRTPISGNYSFEVLQTALLNRNIELKWYNSAKHDHHSQNGKVFIGYIINVKLPLSIFAPNRLLFDSRHWYTITCVQWIRSRTASIDFQYEKGKTPTLMKTNYWVQIDSGLKSVHEFESEIDVENCISKIRDGDNNSILEAWLHL